jgi:hypothetical protein
MKKIFTLVCALLIGGTLTFAQAGGSTGGQNPPAGGDTKTDTSKKGHKGGKKGHKGDKKSKKSSGGTTTPPPK